MKGLFRTKIFNDIKLRHAPELTLADSSMEGGRHIDEIIDEINAGKINNTK